jgi:hypothetical protein
MLSQQRKSIPIEDQHYDGSSNVSQSLFTDLSFHEEIFLRLAAA